ncbi:MAG: hypothetical protein B6I38_04260 [Anaerolineaceae bacterium 4572_5.1]|nr:MAG: hypothetical protein B6I38_04260 [Anaerolineaceae bacterium 4572_5.1]
MNYLLILPLFIYIPLATFYLMLTVTTYRGRRLHQLADYFLILYLGLSFVETLVLLINELDVLDVFVPALRRNLPLYGLLILTGLLINITIILLQKKGPAWSWVIFAAVWIVGAFLLDGNIFSLPDILWLGEGRGFYRQSISFVALIVGLGILTVVMGLILRHIYLDAHTAFLKNRATYWAEALGFFFVGIVLIFLKIGMIGSVFLFIAALAFTYLVRTFRLPDLQVLAFQLLSNTFASLLALLIFTVGVLLGDRLLGSYSWYRPVLSSVVMAFMLILFYAPLLEKVREIIQELIGAMPDRNRALKEYSKSISNVLEVGLLSTISIGLISESLDVKNGALFLVDSIEDGTGAANWRLRGVKGMGDNLPSLDVLPEKTSFARILAEEQRPLTQTEIDISPDMQTIPLNVNQWLRQQRISACL